MDVRRGDPHTIPESDSSSSDDTTAAQRDLWDRKMDAKYEAYKESLDVPVKIVFSQTSARVPLSHIPPVTSTIRATKTLAHVIETILNSPATTTALYDNYELDPLRDVQDIVVYLTNDKGTGQTVYREVPRTTRHQLEYHEFYRSAHIWEIEWDDHGRMASRRYFELGKGPVVNLVMREPSLGMLSSASTLTMNVLNVQNVPYVDNVSTTTDQGPRRDGRRLSLRQRFQRGT